MAKRLISTFVGMGVLFLVFILNNLLVINIAVTIVALIGLSEFYNTFKKKGHKPFEMIGYLITLCILFIGYVNREVVIASLFVALPTLVLLLFSKSVFTNMKYNVIDIAITILGIIYVSFFFSFLAFTCHMENGQYFIWYILGGAWVTDSAAYLIGIKFGKHKFSKISPKKSIEGCIGGLIGCAIAFGIYTYFLNNKIVGLELNLVEMIVLGVITSAISQIGDLSASSIKRYCDEKDFGTIMPGHGGILDRFDSVLMIAPFIYMFFQFIM